MLGVGCVWTNLVAVAGGAVDKPIARVYRGLHSRQHLARLGGLECAQAHDGHGSAGVEVHGGGDGGGWGGGGGWEVGGEGADAPG